jgi:leucyl-tRNA synthetase
MWSLGYEPFVGLATWRQADPTLLVEESVTAVVQIDGKVRSTLTVPARISSEELETARPPTRRSCAPSQGARSPAPSSVRRRSSASQPREGSPSPQEAMPRVLHGSGRHGAVGALPQ